MIADDCFNILHYPPITQQQLRTVLCVALVSVCLFQDKTVYENYKGLKVCLKKLKLDVKWLGCGLD